MAGDKDWLLPEELKSLNITAPPDWNEYDAYLLRGGTLEYKDWNLAVNNQIFLFDRSALEHELVVTQDALHFESVADAANLVGYVPEALANESVISFSPIARSAAIKMIVHDSEMAGNFSYTFDTYALEQLRDRDLAQKLHQALLESLENK